jgi:hypothetical protein
MEENVLLITLPWVLKFTKEVIPSGVIVNISLSPSLIITFPVVELI